MINSDSKADTEEQSTQNEVRRTTIEDETKLDKFSKHSYLRRGNSTLTTQGHEALWRFVHASCFQLEGRLWSLGLP